VRQHEADTTAADEAEWAVLGAIVVRPAALDEIADWLTPEHFRRQHHRAIYAAALRLHLQGQPPDLVTLRDALEASGELETVGMVALTQLGDGVPKTANVEHYARIVREKALIRSLRAELRRLASEAEAEGATVAALLEQAEAAIYRLSTTAVRTDWVSAEQLASELYPVIERLTEQHQPISGVPSGLSELDWITRGWQAGDLVLLGARPSSGKTACALQFAAHAAQTVPVAFFSLEMGLQSIALRALTAEARVDGFRLMSGYLRDESSFDRLSHGLATLAARKLWVDESPRLSPVTMRSKLRRLIASIGALGLVVVDYIQLMDPLPEHRRENRVNQVAGISRALKVMAREFAVPLIALAQLNRETEKTADKQPKLSDLKDSGALEQDGDVVMLLHRPELYERDKPELEGVAELHVAKHRKPNTTSIAHYSPCKSRCSARRHPARRAMCSMPSSPRSASYYVRSKRSSPLRPGGPHEALSWMWYVSPISAHQARVVQ
jgi:replicative DNA helicase